MIKPKTIFFFCLLCMAMGTKNMYGQLVAIPDTNLRIALNELGYIKNDSLNTQSISGLLELTLSDKNIHSTEGLEYFPRLTRLYIGSNQLTKVEHLPPNLIHLSLSSNPIDTLKNLPAHLRFLSCNSCGIETVESLPKTLYALDLRFNKLKILPDIPDSLYYFNFLDNPLVKDSLPKDFRDLACKDYFQNCLPLSMRNFKLFDTTIPKSPEIDSITISMTGFKRGAEFDQAQEFHFIKRGKKYVNNEASTLFFQGDKNERKQIRHKFERAELDILLSFIRERREQLAFCLNDSLIEIDLSGHMDYPSTDPSCAHCSYARIKFTFFEKSTQFEIKYQMVIGAGEDMPLSGLSERQDLMKIMTWLYIYKLLHLTSTYDKTVFTEENLGVIYSWSKK